uniref:Protein kinase domain-containing protein n=1 Tax=Caenorhabditis tropicalis TaxID=1561998 RepID=A0A1I7TPS3_9PELO
MHPEIIVEVEELEDEEDMQDEIDGEKEEIDDVATPLLRTDIFPLKRRNSPYLMKMTEENLKHLRELSSPSPTPTQCSTVSKHEFQNWRISEDVMKDMMHIGTICERHNVCKTSKYVYTITMASYTVTEWKLQGIMTEKLEKVSQVIEDLCSLRHKRLAPIYGYHWSPENELMVFRAHVPQGTVADLETALRYIVHVIDALAYLHERRHVHGKLNDASKEVCDLVDQIFIIDPSKRPSAHSLLEVHGSKSRKTSIRNSLASLANAKEPEPQKPINEFYVDRENDEEHRQLENLIERAEKLQEIREEGGFLPFARWYSSRVLIFSILLVKWVGMVLCAAMSLAVVAGSVFFAIFLIYNGIQIACQCSLNEGFIVLIALILLPIIILLTTLCCNNSLDRYQADVESGKIERSRYVMKTPKKDVIVGGYILVEGRSNQEVPEENSRKIGIAEGLSQMMANRGDFLSGVAQIA